MNRDDLNSKAIQINYSNLVKKEKHLLNEKIIFQHYFEREYKGELTAARDRFEEYFYDRFKRPRDIPLLDNAQKYDVVRNELQNLNTKWETFEEKKEKKVDRLLAINQEIVQSMKEIKIEVIDLNRKIDIKSNSKEGKISAELFEKFFDTKKKKLEASKNKLLEQNKSLLKQVNMIQKKIDSKDKNNDLKFIDFHQLQIENKKYIKEVDDKNKQLLKLKMTIGKISQDKNKWKEKLNNEIKSLKKVSDSIVDKEKKIKKISKMYTKQNQKRKDDEDLSQKLDTKQNNQKKITIDDHVMQKNIESELRNILLNLEKKLQIEHIKPLVK